MANAFSASSAGSARPWWSSPSAVRMSSTRSGISTRPTRRGPAWRRPRSTWRASGATSPTFYKGRGAKLRHDVDRQHRGGPRHPRRRELPRVRQNKRWDLTANQVFSLSDQTSRCCRARRAGQVHGLRADGRQPIASRSARGVPATTSSSSRSNTSIDRQPARAKAANVETRRTMVLEYKGRIERITTLEEQDIDQRLHQGDDRPEAKVYFTQGHGEKDPRHRRAGYSAVAEALTSDNYAVEKLVLVAAEDRARRRHRGRHRRAADRLLPAGDRRAERVPRARAARCS